MLSRIVRRAYTTGTAPVKNISAGGGAPPHVFIRRPPSSSVDLAVRQLLIWTVGGTAAIGATMQLMSLWLENKVCILPATVDKVGETHGRL
jgi:hypothetical protein